MTDTLKQNHTNNAIAALEEIREKGYIKPSEAPQHYQKINYIITNFLETTPINPKDAVQCLRPLTEIGKNVSAFASLSSFQNAVLNLYEKATEGNELTQNQATTQLLMFFALVSPNSIEQKNRLLNFIQSLPDLDKRGNEISKVVIHVAHHYDKNQQFNEDHDLSVLKSISNILHQVILPGRGKTRSNGDVSLSKERLQNCANLVRAHAPELYDHSWEEKFQLRHKNYFPSCSIKEPANVFSAKYMPKSPLIG
ncbi:MAG: hypothetical protein IKQ99_00955 [Alphaproteobacteria bacterium]|nr:hypothetical protein [Alphaproteobacteria bacterium]